MNSEIRDESKKDSFIERAENLKKTLADSKERELQDIARIKNKWENGLTEEEKDNLKRLSQEITKEDAEKEMKESYEILKKFFYEEPVDNYIYWLKLDIMLDIKYGCSLYEDFDENIRK